MSIHGLKLALRRQNITFSLFLTHFISISAQALKLNELTTARSRERCQTNGLMSHAMAASCIIILCTLAVLCKTKITKVLGLA